MEPYLVQHGQARPSLLSLAINEEQHPCHNSEDGQQEIGIRDPQAEQRQ